jgi:hypothetical protein
MADNSSFVSSIRGDQEIQKYVDESLRRRPDFAASDKAFSTLMNNPSLFARGGSFVDPMQLQQKAGQGYLQARAGTEQNYLQNQNNLAQVGQQAAQGLGNITADISNLNAQQTLASGGLFGGLMGSLYQQ